MGVSYLSPFKVMDMTFSLSSTLELDIDLTDEQYFRLCQNNQYLRFERTASGGLT